MNNISPKKLLDSKWTAVKPQNKEKHFVITEVEFDEEAYVIRCVIQAVMTKHERAIEWRDLKDSSTWKLGWI
jgi:tryptophan-rich hypothetical protein